jgi:hypothetical protein
VLPAKRAACFPPRRRAGGRVVASSVCTRGTAGLDCHVCPVRPASLAAARRQRLVPGPESRQGRSRPASCRPARCSAMTISRQAAHTRIPAAKPSATPGPSTGSRLTTTSRVRWPRPGTPAGQCGRPWPPERASARGWPGGIYGQGARSARCRSPRRATATARGCRPAPPGSASVPATQATLLAGQLAVAMQSPDDPPGCGATGRGRGSKGGVGDLGASTPHNESR